MRKTMHFWRNIGQSNWPKNVKARSLYTDSHPLASISAKSVGAKVAGMFVVDAGLEWIGFFDQLQASRKERDREACLERRKRCEFAKADLEMLEREVHAMKEKLNASGKFRAQEDTNKGPKCKAA